ncbi:MAG: hypothetical protein AAF958_12945 [Planctomycetota bacterium]
MPTNDHSPAGPSVAVKASLIVVAAGCLGPCVLGTIALLGIGLFGANLQTRELADRPVVEPVPVPADYIREARYGHTVPGIKFTVTYWLQTVDGNLPSESVLRRISNDVEKKNPGYERYFVCFMLPGMKENTGFFATAHRKPECEVEFLWPTVSLGQPDIPEGYVRAADRLLGVSEQTRAELNSIGK